MKKARRNQDQDCKEVKMTVHVAANLVWSLPKVLAPKWSKLGILTPMIPSFCFHSTWRWELFCPNCMMRIPQLPNTTTVSSPTRLRIRKAAASHLLTRPYSILHPHHAHPNSPNQVLSPITTPPIFHDHLRLASSNNILLLLLFTTSSCVPCQTISPLLQSLVTSRTSQPADRFSALAFAEVELDSPDRSNGIVADLGVEYGISSIPSLAGFGGRRAERVTQRIVDTKMMASTERMRAWLDEWMEKGDPFRTDSGNGSGRARGILGRLFGDN